jgi:hypothetical protein
MSELGFKFYFDICQARAGSLRPPQGSGSKQKRQEHNSAEYNKDCITPTLEINQIILIV